MFEIRVVDPDLSVEILYPDPDRFLRIVSGFGFVFGSESGFSWSLDSDPNPGFSRDLASYPDPVFLMFGFGSEFGFLEVWVRIRIRVSWSLDSDTVFLSRFGSGSGWTAAESTPLSEGRGSWNSPLLRLNCLLLITPGSGLIYPPNSFN